MDDLVQAIRDIILGGGETIGVKSRLGLRGNVNTIEEVSNFMYLSKEEKKKINKVLRRVRKK